MWLQHSAETLKDAHILLVEDDEISRRMVTLVLQEHGFNNITIAADGQQALKHAGERAPDIVLLDIMMPELDGYQFCEQVKKLNNTNDMPILVISSISDPRDIARVFAVGANDLLSKPFNPNEMMARVRVHLENRRLIQELKSYQSLMEQELSEAREMQRMLLPSAAMKQKIREQHNIAIHSHFAPSLQVGGDIWGLKLISREAVAVYAVDFAGHGVSPALNTFRLHTMVQEDSVFESFDPGRYLQGLNERLANLLPTGQFATMFYGILDRRRNHLTYASAGYTHPVLYRQSEKRAELMQNTGTPLGAGRKSVYTTMSVPFQEGDSVFLYSDALTESIGENGNIISEERVRRLVEKILNNDPFRSEQVIRMFSDMLDPYSRDDIKDDLTLTVCTRLPA